MKRATQHLLATLTLLAAGAAGAQNMKPGLWEMSNKLKSGNAETDQAMSAALQHLAKLPPEQRQQMEAMLSQHGAGMPKAGADGGLSVQACITPEMAARGEVPTGQQGKCTSNNQPVAGGVNIAFNCTSPPASGRGQLRYLGDSGFAMTMLVNSSASGKPEQVTVETSGKWLGPTCAAKPR